MKAEPKPFSIDAAADWFRRYGNVRGRFPRTRLYIDLETTGLGVQQPTTLPTQIGYLLITPDQDPIVDATVLEWEGMPGIPRGAYHALVQQTVERMAERGNISQVTVDRVVREGVPAVDALTTFIELVQEILEGDGVIAGHNIYAYDCPIIERVLAPVLGGDQFIDGERILDSGPLLLACQKDHELPRPGVPIVHWYKDVLRFKSKVKWNLAHGCNLFDIQLDEGDENLHDAAGDCLRTHRLFERFEALME